MSRPATFVPPPGARAYRLATARGEFAVIEAGSPERGTALLLPGFTGSKEDFISLHEPLAAAGYRTVAVDGRGQYETPGPADDETPYAQAELAQDVLAQVDALTDGPQERVHLVGHSFGGQVARAAVLLDPPRFRSLTLMSSGPAEISASQQQRVKLLRDALAVMDMAQVWEAIQALEPPEDAEDDLDAGLDDQDDLQAPLAAATARPNSSPRGASCARSPTGWPSWPPSGCPSTSCRANATTPGRCRSSTTWPYASTRTARSSTGPSTRRTRTGPRETAEALAAFWDWDGLTLCRWVLWLRAVRGWSRSSPHPWTGRPAVRPEAA